MSEPTAPAARPLRERAERNLSALVITIEFTLISVMVGVILFPLMDNAAALMRDLRFEYWPYILSGLFFTLLLWTQVISHSLSFVGWPINVGHNLLYIVFALVLGIQMHFLSDPRGWYAVSFLTTVFAFLLAYYDARVIQERMAGSYGSAFVLFSEALTRQRRLIAGMSIAFANAIFNLAMVLFLPQYFLDQAWHVVLVVVQALFVFLLTWNTTYVLRRWTEPIVRKAMEELASESHQ